MIQDMRLKSSESFRSAVMLQEQNSNSAASRAYYAVYQAIVAELSKSYRPDEIDPEIQRRKADPTYDGSEWRHAFCRDPRTLGKHLNLDRREQQVVKAAWGLRVRADYQLDNVKHSEVAEVLKNLNTLLPSLGVTV